MEQTRFTHPNTWVLILKTCLGPVGWWQWTQHLKWRPFIGWTWFEIPRLATMELAMDQVMLIVNMLHLTLVCESSTMHDWDFLAWFTVKVMKATSRSLPTWLTAGVTMSHTTSIVSAQRMTHWLPQMQVTCGMTKTPVTGMWFGSPKQIAFLPSKKTEFN